MLAVARISVAPVKGLGLVHPDEVELTVLGVACDRRFHLVDRAGRLVNGKLTGALFPVQPRWEEETSALTLTFPDGTVIADQVELGEAIETSFYGRMVIGRIVAGPWAEALSALAGIPLRVVQAERLGDAVDRAAGVSLISDGSLAELARRAGEDTVDGRRFRMTFELSGGAEHEEDGWIGGPVGIGAATVEVLGPVGRCVVTTRDPDTGESDLDTLRLLDDYRTLREGRSPAFGVVCVVTEPGVVRVGDLIVPA